MKPVKNLSCNYLPAIFVCLINVYAVNICNIYHRNIIQIQYLTFLAVQYLPDTLRVSALRLKLGYALKLPQI